VLTLIAHQSELPQDMATQFMRGANSTVFSLQADAKLDCDVAQNWLGRQKDFAIPGQPDMATLIALYGNTFENRLACHCLGESNICAWPTSRNGKAQFVRTSGAKHWARLQDGRIQKFLDGNTMIVIDIQAQDNDTVHQIQRLGIEQGMG